MTPDNKTESFHSGIELFNRREFYECHEVLEAVWVCEHGARRLFLQALIHFAVGFYHQQRQNQPGAERQLRKGLKKLAGYLPEFENVDTMALYREGVQCLEAVKNGDKIEPFPRITPAAPRVELPRPVHP